MRPTPVISLPLSAEAAETVSDALSHVWRELFDKDTTGKGAHLREALDRLNAVTSSRR